MPPASGYPWSLSVIGFVALMLGTARFVKAHRA
jgi:hypothetical protein